MSAAREKLELAFARITASGGHPSTYGGGPIQDDDWNRANFPFPAALADATGLDFVKLAAVEYSEGSYGVGMIVAALAPDAPGADEARRIEGLHKLADSFEQKRAEQVLASLTDAALSPADQRARFLDAFAQAFVLRTNTTPITEPSPEAYPLSAQIAALTGLDFATLAGIEVRGGTDGLALTLRRLPDLPARDACLALL